MRTHCVAAATSTVSPRLSTTDEAVALEVECVRGKSSQEQVGQGCLRVDHQK